MLRIAKGFSTDYLTNEVAKGRENYYTSATDGGLEPDGHWYGAGATALGLTGTVDAEVLEDLYSRLQDPRGGQLPMTRPNHRTAEEWHAALLAEHPGAGPELRQELWSQAQAKTRQAVSFFDATFSAPKSVSVLGVAFERAAVEAEHAGRHDEAAGWRTHHEAVEEAVMVGARAALDYLQEVAGFSREGPKDATRWIDTQGWVVAQFLQHDSRERDPQLHVHQAIMNSVECADGKWRTLDGAALYLHRPAAGAIGERAMEAYLAGVLGVRFETRPDGKAREIVGVGQDLMDMFSARTRAIGPKTQELCREWERVHGKPPNTLERSRLAQQATLLTRPAKSHDAETLAERLERWESQTRREVGAGLRSVADAVLAARQDAGDTAVWDPADVVSRALARVAATDATWTRPDLMRAVSDCLPGHLGVAAGEVRPLLEQLTDAAAAEAVRISPEVDLSDRPAEHLLRGGGDVYARPGSARFAAHGQLPAEQALKDAAVERGAMTVPESVADGMLRRYAEHGLELGADQRAALRGVLTSGARVEVLAAPAGTGKTVVVGALAEAWAGHGRAVLGLAPSQVAADVMVDEGVAAVNIDRWLLSREAGIRDGDVVVVDEAGMASTQQLLAVHERCRAAGAKMLLVGDPEQLGAVGPGGALQDLIGTAKTYALGEVRRFTHPWERSASLALRSGDPSCLDEYERAGRFRGSGTEDQAEAAAVRAWLADTLSGKQALLLAGSNEAAERMAGAARAELVRLGQVPEEGIRLGRDGNTCSVGDLVQARRNGWHLRSTGVPVNRATYRVQETREDGSLVVAPVVGARLGAPVRLPADYVSQHVALGYASTVHAGQGRTVDTTHSVISAGWSRALAYVGLTRGRESNVGWVVTRPTVTDAPAGQAREVKERTARAVLGDILARDGEQRSALAERDHQEAAARSEATVVGQLVDGIQRSTAGQTGTLLDHLAARGWITDGQRQDLAADEAMSAVERLLRSAELAGYDRESVLEQALEGRSLEGARSPGQVLHHRLHRDLQVTSTISSFRDLVPHQVRDYHRVWLDRRADDADRRRHELGAELAQDPPAWALDALGAVPEGPLERAGWETRAGWAGAYREVSGHDSESDPLGAAPPAGLAEKHSLWRTAHHHLGLVDRGPEEGLLSDGALRNRVAAWQREQSWAPANVRPHLGATAQAADERRVDGVLRGAWGDDSGGDAEAEALVLADTAGKLDEADRARQAWFDHTAETRRLAERSAAELTARGVDVAGRERLVTAEEWMAAHAEEQAVADRRRPVDRLAEDVADLDDAGPAAGPETAVPDVREVSVRHSSEDVDGSGPASAALAREAVARAQEAMAEIRARDERPGCDDEAAVVDDSSWRVDDEVAAWD